MARCLLLIGSIVLLACTSACSQTAPPEAIKSTAENTTREERWPDNFPNLKTQSRVINDAYVAGDFSKIADLTYPKFLEVHGGRQAIIARETESARLDAEAGFFVKSADAEAPVQLEKIGGYIFAVMPLKVTAKTPKGERINHSSLLAISSDNGQTWTFATALNQRQFDFLFPEAAGKVKMIELTR